jgi:hypothetical protein
LITLIRIGFFAGMGKPPTSTGRAVMTAIVPPYAHGTKAFLVRRPGFVVAHAPCRSSRRNARELLNRAVSNAAIAT